ncbi:BamA/TamA family outer membrane protein, partial [Francisella tularensis]|uniref:BamA/TamA family outer membrane protein n=1 Tax=Francisella tularensis TaxID=263 RepID=UPI002381BB51
YDVRFPGPVLNDSTQMSIGAFIDIGNTYTTYNLIGVVAPQPKQETTPSFYNLKYSVGVEFRWASPMGPLAVSFDQPFNVQ